MTMTRDEAVKVLADHNEWRRGNDDFPATNPTKLGLALDVAIAALSAQEQEPWGWEWVDGSDTGVVTLRQDYEKYKRDYPRMTFTALYAAPPAVADTKQAEPLSPWLQALATVNRLHNLGDAIYDVRRYASENDSEYTGSSWEHPDVLAYSAAVKVLNAALATLPAPPALHQLGAKVEVSDG